MRILVVQGHRNTSGGDPAEMARTPSAARAITQALRAAGHDAFMLQGNDDWFAGGLDDVGRAVMAHHAQKPVDVMLDVHFEGDAGNTRGVFVIVPDGDGLRTLTAYTGSDTWEANPLDRLFAREIAAAVAARTGLAVRKGFREHGVMSEKGTHVGADLGWRLAMFGYTAPARDRMVRLVLELGNIRGDRTVIDRSDFNANVGRGVVEGIARAIGTSAPVSTVSWPPFGTQRDLVAPQLLTVTCDVLNARQYAQLNQPIRGVWKEGRQFWVRGWIIGEEVDGNPVWWITGKGNKSDLRWRVWSGGTALQGVDAIALPTVEVPG